MKWVSQDVEMYLNAKEYVDTAVIPLLPVSFDSDIKQTTSMSEFISLLTMQLERQFKGRILLLPGYPYIKQTVEDKLVTDMRTWEDELISRGFKHVFYVTSDSSWKTREKQLEGSLIWLPSLPLEHMDENYKVSIIEDQVKQLLSLFIQKWHENEADGDE